MIQTLLAVHEAASWDFGSIAIAAIVVLAIIAVVVIAVQAMKIPVPVWVWQIVGVCLIAAVAIIAIKFLIGL